VISDLRGKEAVIALLTQAISVTRPCNQGTGFFPKTRPLSKLLRMLFDRGGISPLTDGGKPAEMDFSCGYWFAVKN